MIKRAIIVSGGNRGLGESIIDLAIQTNEALVISISRSISESQSEFNNFHFIKHDLSNDFISFPFNEIEKILAEITEIYFINNASIILPINQIGEFKTQEISNSLKVNIEFPVNFINFLLSKYSERKLNCVNISSGVGNKPIESWALYSASKSYLINFFNTLKIETENNPNISVFCIDPGVLDTDMQKSIRSTSFPKQNYFKDLKNQNKLVSTYNAAIRIFTEINFL